MTTKNTTPDILGVVLDKLEETGAHITHGKDWITLDMQGQRPKSVSIVTEPYPGFPTDLQAQWVALMTLAAGSSMITDTVYHDRFSHVPELNRFGANIKVDNNTAFVRGVNELVGAPVMSTDIRASASLIVAGLAANGITEVSRVYHIDRGYEQIEEKFRVLGANIWRENPNA